MKSGSAKPAIRAAALLAAAAIALTAAGPAAAGMLGEERELTVRTGVTVRSWTLDRDGDELDVSQITVPLFARVPAGAEGMNVTLFTSGISSDVSGDDDLSLSGPSDTRLGWSWLMPNERFLLSGGLSLPTGPTDLERDEVVVSRAISNQVLGFRANRYGEGLDLFATLAGAYPLGNSWSAGGGFGGRLKGSFDFAPDATNGLGEVEPGDEMFVSGGFSYFRRADLRTTAFSVDLSYRTYGKDKVESNEVFQEGDEAAAVLNGSIDLERWNYAAFVRVVAKGEHTFLGKATPLSSDTPLQKLVLANVTGDNYRLQGMVTYRLTRKLDLTGRLLFTHYSEVDVKRPDGRASIAARGDASIVEPGLSLERHFGDRFSAIAGFSLPSGSADGGDVDLTGFDAYLGTNFKL